MRRLKGKGGGEWSGGCGGVGRWMGCGRSYDVQGNRVVERE